MREVFDEAEQNTEKPISDIISDGWGATQTMTKNLGREITHFIHKHKKPYKKVVARHYFYTETERITLEIGMKNDLFKKKGKREFYYTVSKTPLNPPPKKKCGRPLGSKNKSKNTKKSVKKKTCGRRGLFKVFHKGKRGYVKIDPYRMTLQFSKNISPKIVATLKKFLELFARMTIQNNVAEGSNSTIQSLLKLCGPKTESSIKKKYVHLYLSEMSPNIYIKYK